MKSKTDVNGLFKKRFEELGYGKISEFIRAVRSEKTQETYGAVLNRGKSPDTETLLIMSVELQLKPQEIKTLLIERGHKRIAGLIAPTALSADEQEILELFRTIKTSPKTASLTRALLEQLAMINPPTPADEKSFLDLFRKIKGNAKKIKLVQDMLESLGETSSAE